MNVLVDTSVWSVALRRGARANQELREELEDLIREGRVVLIGPIRQEVLSGVRTDGQFDRLRDALRPFLDLPLTTEDYEDAAACFNRCRRKGIQASNTDFLICAVALRYDLAIFTLDGDFEKFPRALKITLYEPRQ